MVRDVGRPACNCHTHTHTHTSLEYQHTLPRTLWRTFNELLVSAISRWSNCECELRSCFLRYVTRTAAKHNTFGERNVLRRLQPVCTSRPRRWARAHSINTPNSQHEQRMRNAPATRKNTPTHYGHRKPEQQEMRPMRRPQRIAFVRRRCAVLVVRCAKVNLMRTQATDVHMYKCSSCSCRRVRCSGSSVRCLFAFGFSSALI